jgi:hypothetical protein
MKLIPWVMALVAITVTVSAADLLGQDATPAQADKPWSLSFDATFVNKYIWRGQNLNNNASLQPGLAFTYKNLTVSSWSQFSHTGFGDSGVAGNHWTEHDFTVDYGFALSEKISVNVGWINYAFPNLTEGRYTNEIYGGISADTILQPSFSIYVDPHQGDGIYYNLGIGHGLDLGKGFGLGFSASAGLNQGQWIDITTVSDVVLGVSLDVPVSDNVTLSPFWNYITGNDSLRTGPDAFYFSGHIAGVNLNISY